MTTGGGVWGIITKQPLMLLKSHVSHQGDTKVKLSLGRSPILFSFTLVQPSIEGVTVVSYSNWNLLTQVAVCCPFVQRSSLTVCRESWLMVLRLSGSQNFRRATGNCVGSSSVYPINQRNVRAGWERLFAYADNNTLLAVVGKPADRPAIAESLDRDLARIQEWCSHWCMDGTES